MSPKERYPAGWYDSWGRSYGMNNKLLVKKKSYSNDLHVSNYKLGFDDWMPRQSHLEVRSVARDGAH